MRVLYGIKCGEFIKIGVTDDLRSRLSAMRLMNPHPCEVVIKCATPDAYVIERRVHAALAPYAIGREWFTADVALVSAAIKVVRGDLKAERRDWAAECYRKEVLKSKVGTDRGTGEILQ